MFHKNMAASNFSQYFLQKIPKVKLGSVRDPLEWMTTSRETTAFPNFSFLACICSLDCISKKL